jgi:RNA recognition motif-containing protein
LAHPDVDLRFFADQVYVSGLPKDVTEEDLETHFGSIGMLKIDKKRDGNKKKIWLYKDKATGILKVGKSYCWVASQHCGASVQTLNY